MRGWLSHVSQAKSPQQIVKAYALLHTHIETFRDTPILDYDDSAVAEFERLRRAHIRIGANDLKIASICLSYGATLLTRNMKDFIKVPDLRVDDWSA